MTDPITNEAAAAPAAAEEIKQPRKGWVKHLGEGRYHEVDDVDLILQAYPGQYEEAKAGDASKGKKGWAEEAALISD